MDNCKLLFEYCDLYNQTPKTNVQYKNKNIGLWFRSNKINITSINDHLYKTLSINKIVKDNIDRFLNKWGNILNKRRYKHTRINIDTSANNNHTVPIDEQINNSQEISVEFKTKRINRSKKEHIKVDTKKF